MLPTACGRDTHSLEGITIHNWATSSAYDSEQRDSIWSTAKYHLLKLDPEIRLGPRETTLGDQVGGYELEDWHHALTWLRNLRHEKTLRHGTPVYLGYHHSSLSRLKHTQPSAAVYCQGARRRRCYTRKSCPQCRSTTGKDCRKILSPGF
jgi:hypothetical protein